MRTKPLWLWLALLVTGLALVAAGCGGDDNEAAGTGATTGASGGNEAADQTITVNWGTEPPSHDVSWNSGYEVKARLDEAKKVWYGEMRIPFDKIDKRPPKSGNELRINFYRLQGPPPVA